jgi:hypothetical protein
MPARDWRGYDESAVRALSQARPSFAEEPGERDCPFCGHHTVRQYLYRSDRRGHPSIVSYAWCRTCCHFAGSTGPMPDGLRLTDPLGDLAPGDRLAAEQDIDAFFTRLDALWDEGRLPQHIELS